MIEKTFLFPVEENDEADGHAAEVRHVGYVVAGVVVEALEQFEGAVADDNPAGLDGDGDEKEVERRFGEHVAESEKDAEDGSGGSDDFGVDEIPYAEHVGMGRRHACRNRHVDDGIDGDAFGKLSGGVMYHEREYAELYERRAYAARYVVEQEPAGADDALDYIAEHEEGEHVEEQVEEIFLHKHVGDYLRGIEIVGERIVEGADVHERGFGRGGEELQRQPYNHVDYEQIFSDRGERTE